MSRSDRDRWDLRHATAAPHPAPPSPALRWLPSPSPTAQVAIDLACGTGRHTRALRDAGYRVIAADVSRVALAALRESSAEDPSVLLVQIDTEEWPFADESVDMIVQVDFLDRAALTGIRRTVRPGGLLLIDTFAGEPLPDRPGPQRAAYRLAYGELTERFRDWQILQLEESTAKGRAAILARRPPRRQARR